MTAAISRDRLYDLVWSAPLKTIAVQFGISDVGLRKICVRASIPTPERGHWARKEAGKPVAKIKLPPRPPGMSDEVHIGPHYNRYYDQPSIDWTLPPPPPPEFPEPLESVEARSGKGIGSVTCPRNVKRWHPVIQRLLTRYAERRRAQEASTYKSLYDAPLFDGAYERRRLRIFNSLFLATAHRSSLLDNPNSKGREASSNES